MYKFHTHYNKTGTNTTLHNTLSCWVDSSLDHGRHDNSSIVPTEVYPNPPSQDRCPLLPVSRVGFILRRFSVVPAPQHGPPTPALAAALSPAAMSASVPLSSPIICRWGGEGAWSFLPYCSHARGCARQHSLFSRTGAPPWRPHVVYHPSRSQFLHFPCRFHRRAILHL